LRAELVRKWRRELSRPGVMAGLAVLACVVTAVAADKADVGDLSPHDIAVSARPVEFGNPGRRGVGRLRYRGGLSLSSSSPYFGGYSGLVIDAKGERFLAVSDSGSWLSGKLGYANGQPSAVSEARIGAIPQSDGRPLQRKGHRDAEALVALKPGTAEGRFLIAFEAYHRIEEYIFEKGAMRGPVGRRAIPPQLKGMRSNAALEAATMLRGGAFTGALVLFAESKLSAEGHHSGAMIKGGKPHALFLTRHEDYDITEIASLADGSLAVVERSFNPRALRLGIRLRLIKAGDIKPGALLTGETLLDAGAGQEIDNFEGLAVHETEQGETVLTLISDDNFNFLQRTLLLQFTLQ